MSNNDGYLDVCSVCHRSESSAGPMIHVQTGLTVCKDCLQRSFDMMSSMGLDKIPGMDMMGSFDDMFKSFNNVEQPKEEKKDTTDNSKEEAQPSNSEAAKSDEEKTEEEKKNDNLNNVKGPFPFGNIRFVFPGRETNKQSVKPKKTKKNKNPDLKALTLKDLPEPHKIKAMLDQHVVGQDQAKKIMSVAVYNHYKRVLHEMENAKNEEENKDSDIIIEKSNMLMVGPTGSGKTYLLKTLAEILNVPLAITDATSLTEAGYIGDDVESVLSKLLANANNDVEKAEMGIVFIDEIDKIAKKKNAHQRDVSGESVQQGLLKLLEGAEVEVPVGASSKNAMVPTATINTKNILFVCGGAFPELEKIIKSRLTETSQIGFGADLKDKYDNDPDILAKVTTDDLREFGMIPEFLGRLPVIFALRGLDEEMLKKILVEPRNAIIKQYQKLLAMDEVKLEFDDSALEEIAKRALEKNTGARALRAIIEQFMMDIMYEIPKDSNIGTVTITGDYIRGTGGPVITMREN